MSERTSLAQADAVEVNMEAWSNWMTMFGYDTDAKRARALRMSHSVITRLRSGENKPGERFISRTVALGIPYAAVFRAGA